MSATATMKRSRRIADNGSKAPAEANGNGHVSRVPERFEFIALDRIHESQTNPRKVFHGLEEMAESMTVHGVLEPVLVRPARADDFQLGGEESPDVWAQGQFVLVAGARRTRAAKIAGLTDIPAIVRELSDRDVLEIQVIENDQREDVHPLDQARGYQALIEQAGYDVPSLAAKIGRSETYVYQRLQLTKLIKPFQEWLEEERIHLGHAVLIARLQERDQEQLSKDWLFQNMEYSGAPSVKRLREKIEQDFHLNLKSALFPKDDPTLLKDCCACTVCPKRTGANPALWPEINKEDICTDPACYRAKERAFVQLQVKKAEAKDPEVLRISVNSHGDKKGILGTGSYEIVSRKDAKKCKEGDLKTAVVMDRERFSWGGAAERKPGQVVQVRLLAKSSSGGTSATRDDWQKREAARKQKAEKISELHRAIIRQVSEKIDQPLPTTMLKQFIAQQVEHIVNGDHLKDLCLRHGVECSGNSQIKTTQSIERLLSRADDVQLHRILFEVMHADAWDVYSYNAALDKELVRHAAIYGVDAEKVKGDLKSQETPAASKSKSKGSKRSTRARADQEEIGPVDYDANGFDIQRCRVCGCVEGNCSSCIQATGHACWWVEPDLCSACTPEARKARYDSVAERLGLIGKDRLTDAMYDALEAGQRSEEGEIAGIDAKVRKALVKLGLADVAAGGCFITDRGLQAIGRMPIDSVAAA